MDRHLPGILALAPAVYAAAVVLPRFAGTDGGVFAGAAITALAALFTATNIEAIEELGAILLIGMAAFIVIGLFEVSLWGPVSADLSSGALIGLPFLTAGYVLRPRETVLNRIVALQLTLLATLALLVAADALHAGGVTVSGPSFASSFISANAAQVTNLVRLIEGAPHGGFPLAALSDLGFVITSAIALIGVLLVLTRPQTGIEVDLPLTELRAAPVPLSAEVATTPWLRWSQRELLLRRSVNRSPPGRWPPGLGPIVAAAVSACAVLAAAALAPNEVLLVTIVGLMGLLFAVGLVLSGQWESAAAEPTMLEVWPLPTGSGRGAPPEPAGSR